MHGTSVPLLSSHLSFHSAGQSTHFRDRDDDFSKKKVITIVQWVTVQLNPIWLRRSLNLL